MSTIFSNLNLNNIVINSPFSYVDYEVTDSAASWDGLFPGYPNGGIGGCQLSDGNIAITYYTNDDGWKIRLCVVDSSMTVVDTITSDAGPIPYYYPIPALLSNGNVGVGFTDDSDYYAWCAVFNITGSSMLQQPTLIDGNEWYDDNFEVTALVGGGFVVSYLNGTTGGSIRENDGTERVASFTLRNPWRYNRMCALANGDFLIAYPQFPDPSTYAIHNGTTGAIEQSELAYTDIGAVSTYGTCQPMKNPIDDTIQIWYTAEPGTDQERVYVTLLDAAGELISKDNLIYASGGIRFASGRAITLANGSMMAPVFRVSPGRLYELVQWDHRATFKNGPVDLGFSQVSSASRMYPILQFGDGKVVVFTSTYKRYSILSPVQPPAVSYPRYPVSPPSPWVSYFDNTYWTASNYGTWTGSSWVSEDTGSLHRIDIDEPSTWVEGFKPTKVRITYTGGGSSRLIILCGGNILINTAYGELISGEEYDLIWLGHYSDMSRLNIFDDTPNSITATNIEFLLE